MRTSNFHAIFLFVCLVLAACGGGGGGGGSSGTGGGGQSGSIELWGSSDSPSRISLSWSFVSQLPANSTVTMHRAVTGNPFSVVYQASPTESSWTNSGLSPGTSYSYYVALEYSGSIRVVSNTVTIQTQQAVLAAPSNLSASFFSGSIQLTWSDNSNNESGYFIEKAKNGDASSFLSQLGANATSYSDSNVEIGNTYFYRVRMLASGASGIIASNTVEVPLTTGQLNAPTNFGATILDPYTVRLAWDDMSVGESGFEIERGLSSVYFSDVQQVGSNVQSATVGNLNSNGTYYFRIRAVAQGNVSRFSQTIVVSMASGGVLPPSGLTATPVGQSVMRLSWIDNAANETGYEVQRQSLSGGSWSATLPSNTTQFDLFLEGASGNQCTPLFYESFSSLAAVDLGFSRLSMALGSGGYAISSGSATFVGSGGTALNLNGHGSVAVSLPFTFPYPGGSTQTLYVCSNGYVSAGNNPIRDEGSAFAFLSLPYACWAPAFHDLLPLASTSTSGQVLRDVTSSRAIFTWNAVPSFPGGPPVSTFQVQFWATGRVDYLWQGLGSSSYPTLVGFKPSGSFVDPGSRDISAARVNGFTTCTNGPYSPTHSPNITYVYYVRATATAGASVNAVSPPFEFVNLQAPSGLSVLQVNEPNFPNGARLIWIDNSTSEDGFRIEYSRDGVNFSSIALVAPNITQHTVNYAYPMRRNYFRVVAVKGYGASVPSGVASLIPQ